MALIDGGMAEATVCQHSTACNGKEAKINRNPTSSAKQIQKTTPRSLYSVSISWPSDTLWVPKSSFKQSQFNQYFQSIWVYREYLETSAESRKESVRMFACMHVCMYACMGVCMYACMHVCGYAGMQVCRYACIYIQTCKQMKMTCLFPNESTVGTMFFLQSQNGLVFLISRKRSLWSVTVQHKSCCAPKKACFLNALSTAQCVSSTLCF